MTAVPPDQPRLPEHQAWAGELMPGRTCGACTACCREMTVDIPELRKLPGVLCVHCLEGRGCGIYATRPVLCREWHCGWRHAPELDESWRPDRSGIVITPVEDADRPGGYSSRSCIRILLMRPLDSEMWEKLVSYVVHLIERRIPVFLSTSGRPGFTTARTLLNDGLNDAVAAGDRALVSALLERALLVCVRYHGEPITLGLAASGSDS